MKAACSEAAFRLWEQTIGSIIKEIGHPRQTCSAARLVPVPRRELPAITEDLRQPSTSVDDKVAGAKTRIKSALMNIQIAAH
jgi:hypothetical protein